MNLWNGINRRFGSKRGLFRYGKARVEAALGRFEHYKRIDFDAVQRLVFVCAGNICRSPLAERVALDAGFRACSFGIKCAPDRPADTQTVELAARHGYILSEHRTRPRWAMNLTGTDLLVGMEPWHLGTPEGHLHEAPQCTLLGIWHDHPRPYIHDPYNANEDYRDQCIRFLIEATRRLVVNCPHAHREWRTSTLSV